MNIEIDNRILENNNIVLRKKVNALPFALLLLAAVTLGVTLGLDNTNEGKMPLIFLGSVQLILGVIKLFAMPKVLFYTTNEEEFSEEFLFFDSNERSTVLEMLDKGEFTKLKSKAHTSRNLPIKVELHSTPSESIVIYRVYNFIPYIYEPITEYKIRKK